MSSSNEENLSGARGEIDRIDKSILDLLAERNEIVQQVMEQKIKDKLPIFVPHREDDKTQRFRSQAEERGLDPDWAEDFLRMIMSSSRARQSTDQFPKATADSKHILIVGGKGGMGSLYARIAEKTGHHVYILDKGDWDKLDEWSPTLDMAIVSVPINVTMDVIEKLAPKLSGNTILADFTSNKAEPLQCMLDAYDGPVVGLHPMHGPDVHNLTKQLMVVCDGRGEGSYDWFIDQCRLWGMRIVDADPEKHDHVMHMVQGLRHFVALLHGSFMKEYDLKPEDILDYSSPIYRAELMMTGRIFAQSAELYADIVFSNEERRHLLLDFLDHHHKLSIMVRKGDKEAFIEEFKAITDFFGDFAPQALKESGYLINRLADRFA